jgi:hypothetical protein
VGITQTLREVLSLLRTTDNSVDKVKNNTKESLLVNGRLFKATSLPPFVGVFRVHGEVVGFFSRITYKGEDCFITAAHVLTMNKDYENMYMCNGDKAIKVSALNRLNVMYMSPTNCLDTIIVATPSKVFSQLGIGMGKLGTSANRVTPIKIFSIINDQIVFGYSNMAKSEDICMVDYNISTIPGSSGSPILNSKGNGEILGLHLQGGENNNTGVLLPFILGKPTRKETTAPVDLGDQLDISQLRREEWAYALMTEEERAQVDTTNFDAEFVRLMDDKYDIRSDYFAFIMEQIQDRSQGKSWGQLLDDLPEEIEDAYNDHRYMREYKIDHYKSRTGKTGGHINQRIKGGRVRKETIGACLNCNLHQSNEHSTQSFGASFEPCLQCGGTVRQVNYKLLDGKQCELADLLGMQHSINAVERNGNEQEKEVLKDKVEDRLLEIEANLTTKITNITKELFMQLATNQAHTAPHDPHPSLQKIFADCAPKTEVQAVRNAEGKVFDEVKVDVKVGNDIKPVISRINVIIPAYEAMKKLPPAERVPFAKDHNAKTQVIIDNKREKINALTSELKQLNIAMNTKGAGFTTEQYDRKLLLQAQIKNLKQSVVSTIGNLIPTKLIPRVKKTVAPDQLKATQKNKDIKKETKSILKKKETKPAFSPLN